LTNLPLPRGSNLTGSPPFQGSDWNGDPLIEPDPLAFNVTIGDRVSTSDPTMMWLPFYSRVENRRPQVALVAVTARNVDAFPVSPSSGPLLYSNWFSVALPDLYPLPVTVTTRLNSPNFPTGDFDDRDDRVVPTDPFTISVFERGGDPSLPTDEQIDQALVAGAAVVFVDGIGRLRVYRLGSPDIFNAGQTWTTQPGAGPDRDLMVQVAGGRDFTRDLVTNAPAYLIGRPLETPDIDPASLPGGSLGWDIDVNPHVGPSQVVGHVQGRPVTPAAGS
jgi:hypothetical protein